VPIGSAETVFSADPKITPHAATHKRLKMVAGLRNSIGFTLIFDSPQIEQDLIAIGGFGKLSLANIT